MNLVLKHLANAKKVYGVLILLLVFLSLSVAIAAEDAVGPATSLHQERPRISGDKVVWLEDGIPGVGHVGISDVVVYDLATSTRSQVTTPAVANYAAISGDKVVWEDHRKPSGNYPDTDIFSYNLLTSTETTVSDRLTTQYSPDISGTKVVWYEFVDDLTDWDVFIKDTSTGVETKLGIVGNQLNPRISGDKVVFESNQNGKKDIYMYDTSTSVLTQVTSLPGSDQFEPDIDQNRVVFTDKRNGNYDIYSYDTNNHVLNGTRVTTESANQYDPAVSGDTIVWADDRSGNTDIYGYSFTSGQQLEVVKQGAKQDQPDIDQDRVVWADYRGGSNGRIYTKTLTKPDPPNVVDDGTWTGSTSTLHATWDAQPDIVDYQYSIGTTAGTTDVVDWTSVGLSTEATKTGLALSNGQTYYFNARAVNGTGFTSSPGSADGIIVDSEAPTDPAITGSNPATGSVTNDNTIDISWAGATDTVSGVDGFSIEWSQSATKTPDATKDMEETSGSTTSAALVPDGNWWFHLRTRDNAGNWTSTVHHGPFVIEANPPTTNIETSPTPANGDNGWFKTLPQITLTPDETATTFYYWDSNSATQHVDPFLTASKGERTLSYYSIDSANNTETTQSTIFKVDPDEPVDPGVSSSSHTTGTPSNDDTVDITWPAVGSPGGATDTISGVDGYSILWNQSPNTTPNDTKNLEADQFATTSGALTGSNNYFHLRTKDNAGNWTSTVHLGPFEIDTSKPTGTMSINSGAAYTKSTNVTLNLSSSGNQMNFKNDGGTWSGWESYSATKSWPLPSGDGTKKVWVKFKNALGTYSDHVSDTIVLDTKAPSSATKSPGLTSTKYKTTKFKVTWSGSDAAPSSGIASYEVQYKISGGSWRIWLGSTSKKASYFKGKAGKTYYIRSRARDAAGNLGKFSRAARSIVPYDNGSLIAKRIGFGRNRRDTRSGLYKGTVRYSTRAGDALTLKFSGRRVYLIMTKAKKRSKVRIYINNKYIKTINTRSSRTRFRQVVFYKSWKVKRTRTLKIINVGNGKSADYDGLGVMK